MTPSSGAAATSSSSAGAGNDFVDGNGGADSAFLGSGQRHLRVGPGRRLRHDRWRVRLDTHVFNGSGGNEIMAATAVGGHVKFTRNLGPIVMDLNDFEALDVNPIGESKQRLAINDLAGTGLTDVTVDLAGNLGSDFSDGVADTVQVEGTAGVDTIAATANGGAVDVAGLAASVRIAHTDPALDRLTLDTLAGADNVSVAAAVNGLIQVTVQ